MSRPLPGPALSDAPLSVAAVSSRLGVSASTLRTWERRYGLGPGERRAGAHRRYLPEDVARLSRMVELIRSGVGASDAAASVLALDGDVLLDQVGVDRIPTTPAEMEALARTRGADATLSALRACAEAEGVVATWCHLVSPALDLIRSSPEGDRPGVGPVAVLLQGTLEFLSEVASRPAPDDLPPAADVVILSDEAHTLHANLVGVALRELGVNSTILATGSHDGVSELDRFEQHRLHHDPAIAIVMGTGATSEKLLRLLAGDLDMNVMLVGVDIPAFLDTNVRRMRTLTACVEDTVSLARTAALPGE